jgi:hypothetical protein
MHAWWHAVVVTGGVVVDPPGEHAQQSGADHRVQVVMDDGAGAGAPAQGAVDLPVAVGVGEQCRGGLRRVGGDLAGGQRVEGDAGVAAVSAISASCGPRRVRRTRRSGAAMAPPFPPTVRRTSTPWEDRPDPLGRSALGLTGGSR